jgi:hypothetical protein
VRCCRRHGGGAAIGERERAVLEFAAIHDVVVPAHVADVLDEQLAGVDQLLADLTDAGLLVGDHVDSERADVCRITRAGLSAIGTRRSAPVAGWRRRGAVALVVAGGRRFLWPGRPVASTVCTAAATVRLNPALYRNRHRPTTPLPDTKRYFARKVSEGKARREARLVLERQLVNRPIPTYLHLGPKTRSRHKSPDIGDSNGSFRKLLGTGPTERSTRNSTKHAAVLGGWLWHYNHPPQTLSSRAPPANHRGDQRSRGL